VKKGIFSGAAYLTAALSLLAMTPAPAVAQARDSESQDRRRNIRYMEGVLVQAVRVGAEQVGKELEKYEPSGVTVLLGTPRARGFVIAGHGVFFDVEVPDMNQSVVWSVMNLQRDRSLMNAMDSLREATRAMPDGQPQQLVQTAIQLLGTNLGAARATTAAAPAPGQLTAATAIPPDPRKLYQDSVVGSVVDAMLGYSVQMALGAEEWLTVAARGNDAPLGPQQSLQDTVTITVRVKGSDLALYHSDPARRAEIREKVKSEATVF
jgi:hypothetical protein